MATEQVTTNIGHYRKVSISDSESGNLQYSSENPAKEKDINAKCEIQLNGENYNKLAKRLKDVMGERKGSYGVSDEKKLQEQKKQLIESVRSTKAKLDASNKVIEELTKSYKQLSDELITTLNNTITRDINTHKDLNAITKDIREKLKQTKAEIDKLSGNVVSGDVFSGVDKNLEVIKKEAESTKGLMTDIPLEDAKIEGKLFTSGYRLKNRNLNNEPARLMSVNVKSKVYKVKYGPSHDEKIVEVSQKDVCLVSDAKVSNVKAEPATVEPAKTETAKVDEPAKTGGGKVRNTTGKSGERHR